MKTPKDYPNVYKFDVTNKHATHYKAVGQWHSLNYYTPDTDSGLVIFLDAKKQMIRFGILKEVESDNGIAFCFEYLLRNDVFIHRYSIRDMMNEGKPTNLYVLPDETGILSPTDQFFPTHFMEIPTEINTSFNFF